MGWVVEEGKTLKRPCPICKSTIEIIGSKDAWDDVWACPYCGSSLFWEELHGGPYPLKQAVEQLEKAIETWKQTGSEFELSQQLSNARSALVYYWKNKR